MAGRIGAGNAAPHAGAAGGQTRKHPAAGRVPSRAIEARAWLSSEVGLRSHADGYDGRRPVGYVEGWYVIPAERGRALMDAAEAWARKQGCVEMASDTWLHNRPPQRAHVALGFEIAERSVLFRRSLRRRR